MIKGIDVSSYNGSIDWDKAKADGVQFAVLKVIRKDLSKDNKFEANWKGCESAGVTIQGVYNYSYATTVGKAKTDAQRVISILNGRSPMVWLDVEDACQKGIGQRLIDIIHAYRDVIVGAGLDFGVYTGKSFYESYLRPYHTQLQGIPFWIARYPSTNIMTLDKNPTMSYKPTPIGDMYGWQYTSRGSVAGINGNVDLDLWYEEIEAQTVKQSHAHKTLRYGDSGDCVGEMQKLLIYKGHNLVKVNGKMRELTIDKKFGQITKASLLAFQKEKGLVPDAICGAKTWAKLES